jgi:hypothetical protein
VTAPLLVATTFAAVLGTAQGPALDVADAARVDSTRARTSRSAAKVVAETKTVTDSPATVTTAPSAPAPAAVPLPDPPLWSLPTATVPLPAAASWPVDLPGNFLADSIVVEKSERRMTLFYRGIPVQRYRVALGRNPVGDKVSIGDYRTPEGVFWINGRNPVSKFYRSLQISYPDSAHEARAADRGLNPGGNIMIHGLPPHQAKLGASHILADWTEGCIAVTNAEIDELWRAVQPWAVIEIKP